VKKASRGDSRFARGRTVRPVPRPPRLQIAGGLYHVTTNSNHGRLVFRDDEERAQFLAVVELAVTLRGWSCRSYCLLSTHFHLLVATPEPDLSAGMQYINGRYAQWANWHRDEPTHVFGGRFHSILVETESHSLDVHRYIALNPVRAGLVEHPEDWPWSSLAAVLGRARPPGFLDVETALGEFGSSRASARRRLRQFVQDGLRMDTA
jgi:putative transposase